MGKSVAIKTSRTKKTATQRTLPRETDAGAITKKPTAQLSIFSRLSSIELIQHSRSGISYEVFEQLTGLLSFTSNEWASVLQLSERTLQRHQKDHKPFAAPQSERILEISLLLHSGIQVFGDPQRFIQWLNLPCWALGNRKPKELLDTRFGIGLIQDELGRIEHGILA